MSPLTLVCRPATVFARSGEIDETAFRQHLSPLIETNIGINLASSSVGEAYSLSLAEIRRVYEIAVEECKGKIRVHGNPPEQHTAKDTLVQARLAIDAGCEAVNIYPVSGWHGRRPDEAAIRAYYEEVLSNFNHPITLSANGISGYIPSARLFADLANKYHQIIGINVYTGDQYLLELKDRINRQIDLFTHLSGCLNEFLLGANGLLCQQATIIPRTFRQFIDHYERQEFTAMGPLNAGILRFQAVVDKWGPGNARWTKMCMKLLKMPGGEGGVRAPNVMPPDDQLQQLLDGLRTVRLPELDDLIRAAGL